MKHHPTIADRRFDPQGLRQIRRDDVAHAGWVALQEMIIAKLQGSVSPRLLGGSTTPAMFHAS